MENDTIGYGCTASLSNCYEHGQLSSLSSGQVSEEEFYTLMEAVASDLDEGMVLPNPVGGVISGRDTFDTPFYNGGGSGRVR